MSSEDTPKANANESLDGCTKAEVEGRYANVREERRDNVRARVDDVGRDDFWSVKRFVQVTRLFNARKLYGVTQRDIAVILDVSDGYVSKIVNEAPRLPHETRRRSGRPSLIEPRFQDVCDFIDRETRAQRSVTMGVLLAYVTNDLRVTTSGASLLRYMKRHGFMYLDAEARDTQHAQRPVRSIVDHYAALGTVLAGVHPSLIYNMDEMGMEMFADRKDVKIFVRPENIRANQNLTIGVSRSDRRCTLIACIALNGDTVKPAVIVKNKFINTSLFDDGYDLHNAHLFHTETSFISREVFSRWLNEVFLPDVYEKRRVLRSARGDVNGRAVLILDNCSCHGAEDFVATLRDDHNVTMCFLPKHIPHDPAAGRGRFWADQKHHPVQCPIPHRAPEHR